MKYHTSPGASRKKPRRKTGRKRTQKKQIKQLLIGLVALLCVFGLLPASITGRLTGSLPNQAGFSDTYTAVSEAVTDLLSGKLPELSEPKQPRPAPSLPARPSVPLPEGSHLEVHFLDVGQGLSVLIRADEQYMLYDGGDRSASSFVVAYLKEQGITKLDYLVASHYDADHINGLVGALHVFDTGLILGPDYRTDTKVFSSFTGKAAELGKEILHPAPGERYSLGSGYFEILGPLSEQYDDVNDYSIVIRLVYGETSFLITGDAEQKSEAEMAGYWPELSADVLCVGHHGSPTSSSDIFLDKVNPSIAVISCGQNNSYGHPGKNVLERLEARNIPIYRTDESGTLLFISDGKNITAPALAGN